MLRGVVLVFTCRVISRRSINVYRQLLLTTESAGVLNAREVRVKCKNEYTKKFRRNHEFHADTVPTKNRNARMDTIQYTCPASITQAALWPGQGPRWGRLVQKEKLRVRVCVCARVCVCVHVKIKEQDE